MTYDHYLYIIGYFINESHSCCGKISLKIVSVILLVSDLFYKCKERLSIVKKRLDKTAYIEFVKSNLLEGVFAFMFAVIFMLGYLLTRYEALDIMQFSPYTTLAYFASTAVLTSVIFIVFHFIRSLVVSRKNHRKQILLPSVSDRKLWIWVSVAIFICYIPIIVMGNSVLTYDSWNSVAQATGEISLTNLHPVIFTLFLGLFAQIGVLTGDIDYGLVLFSITQSAILAAAFGWIIIWMRNVGIGVYGLVATFLFYSILPINAIAGIIIWKDILFAVSALIMAIFVRKLYIQKDSFFTRKNVFYFVLFAFLFCMLRHNGFYAYVGFIVLAVALNYRLLLGKKYLLILFVPVAIYTCYTSLVSLAIPSPSASIGTIIVPLQQVARTVKYHSDTISDSDKRIIDEVLPFDSIGNIYNPNILDPVKGKFNDEAYNKNKSRYVELWFRLGIEYPKTYLAAFVYGVYGYMYPYKPSSTVTSITPSNRDQANAPIVYEDDAASSGRKTALGEYRDILLGVAPILQNIGFYFCIVFVALYVAILKRSKELVGVFVLLFCILLTTILGPVNGEFRYLYSFVVSVPFVITAVYISKYRSPKKRL